jgi:hypothetical protein
MSRTLMPSRSLRHALTADAVVSGGCGLLQLAGGAGLAALLGLSAPLLQATGVFLLGYAALLVMLATRERLDQAWIVLVVTGNLGWSIACVALVALGLISPSAWGLGWMVLQALVPMAFAAWQFTAARASATASTAAPFGLRGA